MNRCASFRVFSLSLLVVAAATAQSLDHSIPLDDGDPLTIDWGFGVALARDGATAYATVSGDIFGGNNDKLAMVDVITGAAGTMATAQDYPEDPAITYDAGGASRHVYVANSTAGSVTCFTPALGLVAHIPLPLCFGFSSYPFGILVTPDQTRLYVTTLGGCGDVHVIDCDPASGTFNTVVSSFSVPNSGARADWAPYPLMVVSTAVYNAGFTLSQGGFTVVDVTNPTSQTAHVVSAPFVNHYAATTQCIALDGGTVLLSIGGEIFPTLYECDLATGATIRTLDLNTIAGIQLHGLALNPERTMGVVTSLNGGESVFFDLASFTVTGLHDHGSTAMPNHPVFTPDGSRVVVSLQGAARVDVIKGVPGYDLELSATPVVNLGGLLTLATNNSEAGQPVYVAFSLTGGGPHVVGPFTVYLDDPIDLLFADLAGLDGNYTLAFPTPAWPWLSGLTVYFQAGTTDRDGAVRASNGAQVLLN